MPRLGVFLSLFLLLLNSPAYAEVNKEGAAHLQKIFQDIVDYQESVSSASDKGQIVFEGAVKVEPAGDYYAVTLPYASMAYPDRSRLQIGMISINATPHEKPGQWVMSMAVPTPLIRLDAAGKKIFQIDIGKQGAAGIWNEQLEQFVKLDARYQGVSGRSFDGAFTILLPEIRALYDLQQDAGGTWSGPGEITASNVSVDINNGKGTAHLDEAKLRVDIKAYNPAAVRAYKDNLAALIESGLQPEVSGSHVLGVYNMFFDLISQAADGIGTHYGISGLSISRQKAPPPATPEKVEIKQAHLTFDASGLRGNRGKLSLKLGMNGLKETPLPADGELSPEFANLDILIENLPLQDITTLGKNTLQGALANPEMSKIIGMALLMKIPALLSQAGSTITLSDNRFGNASYEAKLDGKIAADISALTGATANIKAIIRGLDKWIALLEKQAAKPETENPEQVQNLLKQLKFAKSVAREEKNADGQTLHVLEFVMSPDGQMLINGQDAKPLLTAPDASTPPAANAPQ